MFSSIISNKFLEQLGEGLMMSLVEIGTGNGSFR